MLAAGPVQAAGRLLDDDAVDREGDALHGPGRRLLASRTVSGKVTWSDNDAVVSGAIVKAYDSDTVGREFMGQATTNSQGKYSISYKNKDWDFCCGDSKRPDIILEVRRPLGGRGCPAARARPGEPLGSPLAFFFAQIQSM